MEANGWKQKDGSTTEKVARSGKAALPLPLRTCNHDGREADGAANKAKKAAKGGIQWPALVALACYCRYGHEADVIAERSREHSRLLRRVPIER